MNYLYICLIGAIVQLTPCYNYRILAIFPLKASSHFNVLGEVAKAIAEKGHQVDVISAYPLEKKFPNYTDLITLPISNNEPFFDFNYIKTEVEQNLYFKSAHQYGLGLCRLLEQPNISNLIHNPPTNPPYDLVLIHLIPGYACFAAIGYLWNVPVVSVITTSLYPYFDDSIGNPLNLAISPRNQRIHKENMTFWDRLYNFVMTHRCISTFHSGGADRDAVLKKYFGDRVPQYKLVEKSLSLIFTNSHYSLHGVRPKVPALIEIGGIHVVTDDNSSTDYPDLKLIMDSSEDGFIYVSFGSRLLIETFPNEIVHIFFAVFEKIAPVQIIMKIKNPELLGVSVPKNVHYFSWVPQKRILQHSNIKAFVTHGGGLSIQEAVYYGVPVICAPVYADQFTNCDIASNKKIGLKLDIDTAELQDYFNVFDNILNDSKFRKASSKLSSLYRDRLISPREEAAYWVEYVIRHGKDTLRSPTVDLKWWQIELLDVLTFIAVVILMMTGITIIAVKQLFRIASQTND